MDHSSNPSLRSRLAIGGLFAAVAAVVAFRAQFRIHAEGGDHFLLWRALHTLLHGGNIYSAGPGAALFDRLFYPLPAVLLAAPFGWLDPSAAALAFTTCAAFLLGFAITRDSFSRVPLVLSVPFLAAAQFSQSAILILAFGLIQSLSGLTVMKPNLGLALFAWQPSKRFVIVAAALVAISVAAFPHWPLDWLDQVRTSPAHHAPLTVGVGAIGLLAALRWRTPEGRLLLAMTLIPHGLYFYDELPLWLVARTRIEAMILTGASWIGCFAWMVTSEGPRLRDAGPWIVCSLYVPAVVIVLRRPNRVKAAPTLSFAQLRKLFTSSPKQPTRRSGINVSECRSRPHRSAHARASSVLAIAKIGMMFQTCGAVSGSQERNVNRRSAS